jgi:sigma-B regulation protein RsbU (phosphoserine phosphatase)
VGPLSTSPGLRRYNPAVTDTAAKHMQCMEVWGGNRRIDTSVVLPGLDAWVYSQPHGGNAAQGEGTLADAEDGGGGDVHYVSSCASGMIARILVADVAGHGLPVSETADRLRRLMRRHINDHDQVRLMRSLNREFAAVSTAGRFATAVAFTFNATTGRLIVTNAGHPPPMWYRSHARRWEFLTSSSVARKADAEDYAGADGDAGDGGIADVPFGIEDAAQYSRFEVRIGRGDVVLCYTDSLPESRSAAGDMLGNDGLLAATRALAGHDPGALVRDLLHAVFGAGAAPADDVTVVAFRPNGLRSRIPFHDRLLAPLRYLWAVAGSLLSTPQPR